MRCKEASRLMTENPVCREPELLRHVRQCPACERSWWATQEVDRLLKGTSSEVPLPTLAAARRQIEHRAAQMNRWNNIMAYINDHYQPRMRLMAGLGLSLALLVVITLVPFSHTRTAGYKLTAAQAESASGMSTTVLSAAIGAIGYRDVTVTRNQETGDYVIDGLPSEDEARIIARGLAELSVFDENAVVEPVEEQVHQTIFAQVREIVRKDDRPSVRLSFEDSAFVLNGVSLEKFMYDAELADREVRVQLEKLLEELGISDAVTVNVETSEDDSRIIRMAVVDEEGVVIEGPPRIEMYVTTKEVWVRDIGSGSTFSQSLDVSDSGQEVAGNTIELIIPGGDRLTGKSAVIRIKRTEDRE